mmetsp:Transcript_47917/g.94921  ORF Transcript_47917/g.94921 Transcript_47917/m.94921 type:complete len:221 (-) Transcript_47917:893-1555(-)
MRECNGFFGGDRDRVQGQFETVRLQIDVLLKLLGEADLRFSEVLQFTAVPFRLLLRQWDFGIHLFDRLLHNIPALVRLYRDAVRVVARLRDLALPRELAELGGPVFKAGFLERHAPVAQDLERLLLRRPLLQARRRNAHERRECCMGLSAGDSLRLNSLRDEVGQHGNGLLSVRLHLGHIRDILLVLIAQLFEAEFLHVVFALQELANLPLFYHPRQQRG